jgi:hypothetical protein
MLFLMCLMVVAGSAPAVVINFDFQAWDGSGSITYSGQGALRDPGNDYWNAGGFGWDVYARTNLVASDGVTVTTVDFALTFSKHFTGSGLANALMADFRYIDSGSSPATLTFSQLEPLTPYRLYLYGAGDNPNMGCKFTSNGITKETAGTVSTQFIKDGNYVIIDTESDAAGVLVVTWALRAEADLAAFNGFQITPNVAERGEAHTPVPAEFSEGLFPATVPSVSWYSPEQDKNGNFVDDPNIVSFTYDIAYYIVNTAAVTADDPNMATKATTYTNVSNLYTLVPPIGNAKTMFWRVDTHVAWDSNEITGNFTDVIPGKVWQFTTRPAYIAPSLAFNSVITTQAILPAALSATVTGNTDTITSAVFTLMADDFQFPVGAIASLTNTTTNNVNPTATLTTDKPGVYKVKLVISDGITTVEKIAEVVVYTDACAAKKASPGGWTANYYDRDGNCLVKLSDFAVLAAAWLDDTTMKAQETY